jgi:hypothetical protein
LWPVPILRWAILGIDMVMLAATPIDGSHYVVDVAAGIAIAAACLFAARAIAHRASRPGLTVAAPAAQVPRLVAGE